MMEQEFLCWRVGQREADAKEIKAESMEEAAKMAVDIWRHEKVKELGLDKVTVFVKDTEENKKSYTISRQGDSNASEAFH